MKTLRDLFRFASFIQPNYVPINETKFTLMLFAEVDTGYEVLRHGVSVPFKDSETYIAGCSDCLALGWVPCGTDESPNQMEYTRKA